MHMSHIEDSPPCKCQDAAGAGSPASGAGQDRPRAATAWHYENAIAYLNAVGGLDNLLAANKSLIDRSVPRYSMTIRDLHEMIQNHAIARKFLANNSSNIAAVFLVSDTILDGARRRVEAAEDRFARAINDPRLTPGQLDEEQIRAKWDICATLKLVRDHNDDNLPDDLDRIWTSWSCKEHLATL
jgi:hypothetical protein